MASVPVPTPAPGILLHVVGVVLCIGAALLSYAAAEGAGAGAGTVDADSAAALEGVIQGEAPTEIALGLPGERGERGAMANLRRTSFSDLPSTSSSSALSIPRLHALHPSTHRLVGHRESSGGLGVREARLMAVTSSSPSPSVINYRRHRVH